MAGYKQAVLDDKPVSFWTFDYDEAVVSTTIIDEISNKNPMLIHGANFALEKPSLNKVEMADQYSAWLSPNHSYVYENAYFSAPHTVDYNFFKAFTVEFLYYKASPLLIREAGQPGHNATIISPIIDKGSLFACELVVPMYSIAHMKIRLMGVDHTVGVSNDLKLFNVENHVIFTCWYEPAGVDLYALKLELYINGRLVMEVERFIPNFPPNFINVSPFRVGANGGADPVVNFQSELLKIDQISVYDYKFTQQKISDHYRKTRFYEDIIMETYPTRYYRMDDQSEFNNVMQAYNSTGTNLNGEYHGGVSKYRPGPPRLLVSRSVMFPNYSTAFLKSSGILGTSTQYSIEFWFKTNTTKTSCLLSYISADPNWRGVKIMMNMKNQGFNTGTIEVAFSSTQFLTSVDRAFNDNEWHHLVLRYNDGEDRPDYVDLIIDNAYTTSRHTPPYTTNAGTLYLMNDAGGIHTTVGELSEVAFYSKFLTDIDISNRFTFSNKYWINGYTYEKGNPVSAEIRVYDTLTGQYKETIFSNPTSGNYKYFTSSSRYLNLHFSIPGSRVYRDQILSQVKPAFVEDAHL